MTIPALPSFFHSNRWISFENWMIEQMSRQPVMTFRMSMENDSNSNPCNSRSNDVRYSVVLSLFHNISIEILNLTIFDRLRLFLTIIILNCLYLIKLNTNIYIISQYFMYWYLNCWGRYSFESLTQVKFMSERPNKFLWSSVLNTC